MDFVIQSHEKVVCLKFQFSANPNSYLFFVILPFSSLSAHDLFIASPELPVSLLPKALVLEHFTANLIHRL
jgi:hypothetical protein